MHAFGTKMVFHIAGTLDRLRIDIIKFRKDRFKRFVDNISQHV